MVDQRSGESLMSDVQMVRSDGAMEAASKANKGSARSLPKWEADARDRLHSGIRRFSKPLADMVERDANEGDPRLLVTDFLCDALGFDKFEHLTTEYLVKGEFADYGIRLDKQLVAFHEVKRVTTKLGAKHLHQVEMYAINEGVEWIILTNGNDWQVYHFTGSLPVVIDLVMSVSLLGEASLGEKVNQLFYLTRDSLRRRQIDELWLARRATSPKSLGTAILSEPVVATIRKGLKRSTGHHIEPAELTKLMRETVLRPECLA
jgi:hypothetical protein